MLIPLNLQRPFLDDFDSHPYPTKDITTQEVLSNPSKNIPAADDEITTKCSEETDSLYTSDVIPNDHDIEDNPDIYDERPYPSLPEQSAEPSYFSIIVQPTFE